MAQRASVSRGSLGAVVEVVVGAGRGSMDVTVVAGVPARVSPGRPHNSRSSVPLGTWSSVGRVPLGHRTMTRPELMGEVADAASPAAGRTDVTPSDVGVSVDAGASGADMSVSFASVAAAVVVAVESFRAMVGAPMTTTATRVLAAMRTFSERFMPVDGLAAPR